MLTQDYEMLFLKAKEKQYLELLEKQRYYEIFELPFLIKQMITKIEVQIDSTQRVSDLRKKAKPD